MEKKIFNISIPIDSHGDRIDKFLQSQLNNLSRTRLQSLIRDGYVKLNNTTIHETSKKIKNLFFAELLVFNFGIKLLQFIQILYLIYNKIIKLQGLDYHDDLSSFKLGVHFYLSKVCSITNYTRH